MRWRIVTNSLVSFGVRNICWLQCQGGRLECPVARKTSGAKKLLETLHRELPMVQKKVYCGISSMIYFCAKLETPWEDVHPVSLHGRECNLPGLLRIYGKIFAIVGTTDGIAKLCQKLQRYGMGGCTGRGGRTAFFTRKKRITRGVCLAADRT